MDRSALRHASAHVLLQPGSIDAEGAITVDDATEHHLRRVLRLRDGDVVSVTDGAGRWRLTNAVVGPTLLLDPASAVQFDPPRSHQRTIATAIPKGDRFDWLVQKVTELGIDRLVLLHAERSVVRWKSDRIERHLERSQRIADEALRQSRRVRRLRIDGPVVAATVLAEYVVAEPDGRAIGPHDVSVAIGPEGGWSAAELAVAGDRVGLGPTILRTETAAVAVAAQSFTRR